MESLSYIKCGFKFHYLGQKKTIKLGVAHNYVGFVIDMVIMGPMVSYTCYI